MGALGALLYGCTTDVEAPRYGSKISLKYFTTLKTCFHLRRVVAGRLPLAEADFCVSLFLCYMFPLWRGGDRADVE